MTVDLAGKKERPSRLIDGPSKTAAQDKTQGRLGRAEERNSPV